MKFQFEEGCSGEVLRRPRLGGRAECFFCIEKAICCFLVGRAVRLVFLGYLQTHSPQVGHQPYTCSNIIA